MNSDTEISQRIDIVINGESSSLESGTRVADLLKKLNVESAVAVEINGQIIARRNHEQVRLANGDQVEVVSLSGGG